VFFHLLSRIKRVCVAAGAELRIAYIPARYDRNRNVLQDLLAEWSTQNAVPYIDITAAAPFAEHAARQVNYFRVDNHLNVQGHERMAEVLQDFLARTASDSPPLQPIKP
jgi:hypothetical protein